MHLYIHDPTYEFERHDDLAIGTSAHIGEADSEEDARVMANGRCALLTLEPMCSELAIGTALRAVWAGTTIEGLAASLAALIQLDGQER